MKTIKATKINDVEENSPSTLEGKARKMLVQIFKNNKGIGGKQGAIDAIAALANEAVGGGNLEVNMLIQSLKKLGKEE